MKYKITNLKTKEETLVDVRDCRGVAAVVGADSFVGVRMAEALASRGRRVLAFGGSPACPRLAGTADYSGTDYARYDLPPECRLVLFCHDVSIDRERHLQALSALCEHLAATRSPDAQVRLCYFSSANICNGGSRPISENAAVRPHCLRELAVCQAEMTLRTWACLSRNAIVPNVFRHGELYGGAEDSPTNAGHVNECLDLARHGRPLEFSGNLNQRRTLVHVEDFAAAVASLLDRDLIPDLVNVPGERLTVYDYLSAISERYGVELTVGMARRFSENLPLASCDRVLSASLFRSEVDFKPKYKFRPWLKAIHNS